MSIKRQAAISSFISHRFNRVGAHILLLVVGYLFYSREILLGHVEVIDSHLVHRYIHYRTVCSLPIEIGLPNLVRTRPTTTHANTDNSSTVFFLHLFARLENWRQKALVLNERTVVEVLSDVTLATSLATSNIVFEITVKSLVFAILNFQVSKITTAVLSGQGTLLHVDVVILFLLFRVDVSSTGNTNTTRADVVTVLVIEGTIRDVIRYLTHTLRIN